MATGTPANEPDFYSVAFRGDVVRRALKMSVIVGTLLMLINHGDAIWRRDVGGWRALRIVLTYLVPYTVSTLSSTAAIRSAVRVTTTSPTSPTADRNGA